MCYDILVFSNCSTFKKGVIKITLKILVDALWGMKMDLLWVPASSLILNNFINVNRSSAHINERINSLSLVALQLMICNKQCKMLSNFLPSNDTLSRRGIDLTHHRVGKTRGRQKGFPAGGRPARGSAG